MHKARPQAKQHIMSNCWVSWFLWFFLTTGICWHIVKQRITAEWVLLVPSSFKQLRVMLIPHWCNGYVTSGSTNHISKFQRATILFSNFFPDNTQVMSGSVHYSLNTETFERNPKNRKVEPDRVARYYRYTGVPRYLGVPVRYRGIYEYKYSTAVCSHHTVFF